MVQSSQTAAQLKQNELQRILDRTLAMPYISNTQLRSEKI